MSGAPRPRDWNIRHARRPTFWQRLPNLHGVRPTARLTRLSQAPGCVPAPCASPESLMPKGSSAHDQRRPVLLQLLIETRTKAKLTQVELAEAAGVSQPYVSQVKSGLIRLDGLQLVDWLHTCDSNLGRFGANVVGTFSCGSRSRRRISVMQRDTPKSARNGPSVRPCLPRATPSR